MRKESHANYEQLFLSTPSARRATLTGFFYDSHHKFLSTPSARRATKPPAGKPAVIRISIHALREEGDVFPKGVIHPMSKISIHALREEGDGLALEYGTIITHFYPRPPRGGRPGIRFGCS